MTYLPLGKSGVCLFNSAQSSMGGREIDIMFEISVLDKSEPNNLKSDISP